MDKVEDIVGRLRDKSAHSAEAYGLEEYVPMAKFWKSYADLSSEAADLIQSQQALIEEMREALRKVGVALGFEDKSAVLRSGVKIGGLIAQTKALSQKE